jgi:hypothetical protein
LIGLQQARLRFAVGSVIAGKIYNGVSTADNPGVPFANARILCTFLNIESSP